MRALLLLSLLATTPAEAARVYINDVRADALRDMELRGVDVRFDERGDIYIIAPNYNIEVVGGSDEEADSEGAGEAVAEGVWWLVTQDNASSGHEVEVYVGDTLVKTIRSGGAQVIMDLGPYLVRGENTISFVSKGGEVGGGLLQIYVGQASNEGGTLNMATPQIDYKRRSTDSDRELRDFVLVVD